MFRIFPLLLIFNCLLQLPAQQAEPDARLVAQIEARAEKGDAQAQLELGLIYSNGAGVKKDLRKAAKWHRKAAEQGLAQAQYRLGLNYANGEGVKASETEAVRWFRRAADQGLVEAQYELGFCCLSGRGTRESGAEAVDWFRKAAALGFAPAEYQIGECYFQGTGVPKNIEEGIKWIRSAAEKGVPAAQNKLGVCCQKGEGVPKNYVEAYKWFALAAAQDDARALDIKVSIATLESNLTKDQIAEAQQLARDFKPNKKSQLASFLSPPESSTQATSSLPSGTVIVKANPEDCEVFVDGAFVGNSPAKLKLPEGPHVIEVKKAGHKDYRRELKVIAGSELTLSAVLAK